VFQHPHRGWGEQDSDDRDHGIAGVGAWSTSRRPRTTVAMKNTTASPTARPATSSGEPCWAAAATATNTHPHSSVVIPPASTTWANSRRVWPRSINRDATTLIAVTDSTMPRNAAWSGGAPNTSHAKAHPAAGMARWRTQPPTNLAEDARVAPQVDLQAGDHQYQQRSKPGDA
jgi:hypothetical protein